MNAQARKNREPTFTSRVEEALSNSDDFRTARQLAEASGLTLDMVAKCLHYLKQRHAVDAIASDGDLWWYTTPQNDDRMRRIKARVHETSRRSKPRAKRAKTQELIP